MKRIVSLLATLCLFQSSHAATAVPDAISYQGRALTATGTLMGAGTPVNRTVIFRIWDHPSNSLTANLIYSEQQVVTIAEGEFSVLVGTGAATAGTPLSYSETSKGPEALPAVKISDAFGGISRYLGVTIDDGTTAVDNEISPRQQIVSGAFALRSKFAESIGSATDLTLTPLSGTASNYGLGWYGTDRLFATTAVDGPVLYGNAGGALGSNVGGTQKLALRWDASGRVSIGATSINTATSATNKLTLVGDVATTPGDQFTIRGNTDNNKRLLLGYDTTANKASLQSYTAASTAGPLLLNPSGGNVGVNNTAPSVALEVTGAIKASTNIQALGNVYGSVLQASNYIEAFGRISANGSSGFNFFNGGDTDGGLYSPADGTVTIKTNGAERVRVDSLGNVGIGTSAPGIPLNFGNVFGDKIAFWGNSGSTYGFGVQGGLLQIHTDGSAGDIAFGYGSSAAMTETMRIKGTGRVGIGTTTPAAPLQVAGTGNTSFYLTAVMDGYGARVYNATVYFPHSIIADSRIKAGAFDVVSDVRIKNVQKISEGGEDLATLMKIQITDYLYKDEIANGKAPQKKVIAQQVETVFPQAVIQTTDSVPDLFKTAAVKGGWVELATDLKKGDRVKLIGKTDQSVHEVLEVRDGAFHPDGKMEDEQVFVYGREVNDFRSVDYDAISMLNVSATQQVKREKDAEIQTLRDENAALRREIDSLRSELATTAQS
ncbi:tail fiber domain-containing protein, partial [bacterium]|nr:tail fiber domain-containing protein [bacterium]